jgi:hypothetical protein
MQILLSGYPYMDYNTGLEVAADTTEKKFQAMRFLRDILLKECDWVVMPDSVLPDDVKAEWIAWRQWMRDITTHRPEVTGDFVEVPDPPIIGRPKSWVNVDPAFVSAMIERMSHAGDETEV